MAEDQDVCDWCSSTVTADARARSTALGLTEQLSLAATSLGKLALGQLMAMRERQLVRAAVADPASDAAAATQLVLLTFVWGNC